MNEDLKKEIKKMIRQELISLIPEIFGRTLVQIKAYLIKNIT